MPDIATVQDSAQHCFEVARSRGFLEEDIALEAFELLTANDYDRMSAHALGVSV